MFDVHDIVFARLEGFPFWPARVITPTSHHLRDLRMPIIPSSQRLVLFYNDDGRYAAMEVSDLRNFDNPRLQERTKLYEGRHKSQLRTAFETALEEYQSSQPPSNNPSSTTNSPRRKPRSNKSILSDPTSPVTRQSESRQTTTKVSKVSIKHSHHSTSAPCSPHHSSHRKHRTPHAAPRTQPDSAPSNRPPRPLHRQKCPPHTSPVNKIPHSANISKVRHPSHSQPSQSVQLRLRLKRKSTTASPSSPSPQNSTSPSAVKRRRLVKNDSPKVRRHLPVEHSEKHIHDHSRTHNKPHSSNEKIQTAQPPQRRHNHISEKVTSFAKPHTRISADLEKMPGYSDRRDLHHVDEKRQPNHALASPISQLERNQLRDTGSQEVTAQGNGEHNSDQVHGSRKRKRSSKDGPGKLEDSDIDDEQRRKEMRPASKRSLDVERPRRIHEAEGSDVEEEVVKGGDAMKELEDQASTDPEKMIKVTKAGNAPDRSTAFDHLSKGKCIELIEHLQETVRYNNVELWRRGIKLAEKKNIITTETGLIETFKDGIQMAEEMLTVMKSGREEKSRVLRKEAEAYEACKAFRDVYFDVEKMKLKTTAKRLMDLAKNLQMHSVKVSRVLLDVIVMWADLIEESTKKESTPMEEKEKKEKRSVEKGNGETHVSLRKRSAEKSSDEAEKGSAGKKRSAREERLQKFDRKMCFEGIESLFANGGNTLRIDENDRLVLVKQIEREIRPRFEEDKPGYYKSSVSVIRGIRKGLRHLAAKGGGENDAGKTKIGYPHTSLLHDAIEHRTREKTRLFVSRLLVEGD